jgi:Kef-type K+ transport system membrane component KefB
MPVKGRSTVQFVLVGAALLAALLSLVEGLVLSRGAPTPTDDLGRLALGLAIVVTAAFVGGHVAARFGQPAVLGELLAGIAIGNVPAFAMLHFVGADQYLDVLSRIGMLLLLFQLGLALSVKDLFAVGPSCVLVAVIGTVSSLAAGAAFSTLLMPNAAAAAHLFLGAGITATSVGITARVLKDLSLSQSGEAKIILGAAVVDDILALMVLGAVTAWVAAGSTGGSTAAPIVSLVMKTAGFLVLAVVLGSGLTPIWFRRAAKLRTSGALLAFGLCFCFFLSWASAAIGLAPLVGAFAAGLVLEDAHSELFVQRGEPSLDELVQPIVSFLVPMFFVLVGFRANLGALIRPVAAAVPLALALAAVGGKLACAGGVLTGGVRRLTVAIGMIPRGEVTLVFAALGRTLRVGSAPLLDESGYTALVAVVVLTTLITPTALKWSLDRKALISEKTVRRAPG